MSTITETTSAFETLIQSGQYEYYFERGQIVSGQVSEYEKDGVLINIGAKSEAFLPAKELADYAVSDPSSILQRENDYEFYILRDEAANSQDGRIIVSYKRVAQARIWSSLEEVRDNDDICEARIQEVVKGGVVVEIDGLRGFIPASHLRVKGGSNNPQLVGETIPCTILEIDRGQSKLILSQKLAISKLYAGEREKLMQDLHAALAEYDSAIENGESPEKIKITGEIVRITDFGAFVKIEDTEMDGLLPLSEIQWARINHPSEVLKIGDQLTVQVLNVVPEQSRISLSLKRLQPDPWDNLRGKINIADVITAITTKHNNFGVHVSINVTGTNLDEIGFECVLPYDNMKKTEGMSQNDTVVSHELEQEFKAVVKKIKEEERRVVLSTLALGENGEVLREYLDPEPEEENSDEG